MRGRTQVPGITPVGMTWSQGGLDECVRRLGRRRISFALTGRERKDGNAGGWEDGPA